MRIVAILFISLLFLQASLKGENENGREKPKTDLEVMVVDASTIEPIPAVKIKIDQNNTEAYTDFEGMAKFVDVVKGTYDIEISFISYQKQRIKDFQVHEVNQKLLIKLQP